MKGTFLSFASSLTVFLLKEIVYPLAFSSLVLSEYYVSKKHSFKSMQNIPHPVFWECCHPEQILSNCHGKSRYDAPTSLNRDNRVHERASECHLDSPLARQHRGTKSWGMTGWGTRPAQILGFHLVSVMSPLGKKLTWKPGLAFFILSNNDLFFEVLTMGTVFRQCGHLFFWANLRRMLK